MKKMSSGQLKKEAEKMIKAFVDITMNQLKAAGTVNIAGFGQFSGWQGW